MKMMSSRSDPEGYAPRSAMGLVEERMGLRPIEELLAERGKLVEEAADLRARYGSFGTWDAWRKAQLATIAMAIRASWTAAGEKKVTEAAIEEAAHADPRYIDLIITATTERARLTVLEAHVEAIDATIQRANAIARYLTSEARL